jgi:hypothetical protein
MAINQLSSANTFEQWLIATQALIAFANSITDSSGGTFTSNTSLYVITGNLTVGNTVTAPTVNTDVIIFDDGTRLTSNVPIVNAYNHANGAFNKANAANVLAQAAFDYANTISLGGEISGDNVIVLYTVTGNNIVANNSITSNSLTTNTVTTNTLTANTVTTNSIPNVNSNVIVSNTVSSNIVVGNSFTSNTLVVNTSISTNTFTGNSITLLNTLTTDNVTANLITAVDVNTTSDVTLKYNMQQITNAMEVLEKLTGFQFNWKSDGIKSYGLSAQDVEKVLPEIVRTREDGFKGINYLNLIAFLIEAIKEMKKEMAEIKNGINKQ